MRISDEGLRFIAGWEGFVAQPYNDAAGHATIGYGHLLHHGPVTAEDRQRWGTITRQQGLDLLRRDIALAEGAVNQAVKVTLTQEQFDALVSLTFNIGTGGFRESTLLRKLNGHDYTGARAEFAKWVYAGGRRIEGLENRRREEAELFGSLSREESRKRAAWQARLEKLRRVANSRRRAGRKPVWTVGMRVKGRIYKQLLARSAR